MLRSGVWGAIAVGALVLAGIVGWILSDRAESIGWALLLLAAALVLGAVLGWFLHTRARATRDGRPRIPDRLEPRRLAKELAPRLAGRSAENGATLATSPTKVVWVEGGDEVLVHLDEATVRCTAGTVFVSVPLETDQTGKQPLVVALAVGNPDDPAGLVCMTDELPFGDPLLAARWGRTLQTAVWSGVLSVAADHAAERGTSARAVGVRDGELHVRSGDPLRASTGVRR